MGKSQAEISDRTEESNQKLIKEFREEQEIKSRVILPPVVAFKLDEGYYIFDNHIYVGSTKNADEMKKVLEMLSRHYI